MPSHFVTRFVWATLIASTLLASSPRTTRAQANNTARSAGDTEYENILRDALAEYDAGRYEEAAALFSHAYQLSPNARTHRGLGLTYFEARKYALAATHLRAALADTRRPLTAQQRSSTETLLHQAEAYVAHVRVLLMPGTATLAIDGYTTELTSGEALLDAGHHELISRADGYTEDRRTIDAVAGTTLELRIELTPTGADVAVEPPTAATTPVAASQTATNNAPMRDTVRSGHALGSYIVMAAGGALLIGAAVTGAVTQGIYDDLNQRCKAGCATASATSDRDKGKTLQAATNGLLVGGIAAVVTGAVWWLVAPGAREQPVSAACTPGTCAVDWHGTF